MREKRNQKIIWQTSLRLILSFFAAGIVTLLIIGTVSYSYLKDENHHKINEIIETVSPSLSSFSWKADDEGAEKLIKNLLKSEYIQRVQYVPDVGSAIDVSKKELKSFFSKTWQIHKKIIYKPRNEQVGKVIITTGNNTIFKELWDFLKVVIIVTIFCLVLFCAIVILLLRSIITQPLESLTDKLKHIQSAEIEEVKIDYPFKNEITKLVDTINRLLLKERESKLEANSYLRDIEKKSKELEESEKSLQRNFEERVTELNKMKEFSTKAKKEADKGKLLVDEGRDIVQKLVFNMRKLEKANRKLEDLKEKIYGISKKTRKINNIVSESRLLSFNAEIEAAQAGKFGKGFSVVASEMGNLALNSGELAKEIGKTVDYGLKDVEEYFEQSSKNIKVAQDSTVQCLDSFREVDESLEKIFVFIDEIAKTDDF